jgi:hypothetical protein
MKPSAYSVKFMTPIFLCRNYRHVCFFTKMAQGKESPKGQKFAQGKESPKGQKFAQGKESPKGATIRPIWSR